MAITQREIEKLLEEYQRNIRHPNRTKFGPLQMYDLDINRQDQSAPGWPGKYPDADEPGVYFICDEHMHLLYIGKASWNNSVGARLGSYFGYNPDSSCKVIHNWTRPPRHVGVLPMNRDSAFEAAALEEYLITRLPECPPDNTIGSTLPRRIEEQAPEVEA